MRKNSLIICTLISLTLSQHAAPSHAQERDEGWLGGIARKSQNFCYNVMARTFWDPMMSGFQPGRKIAMEQLDIQPSDRVLFVGEGTGLDFDVLPATLNKANLYAFDFSPEMVKQAKLKAPKFNIPVENCFEGDAQRLSYTDEKFDKIYFPLSLGSIPDPHQALKEAERVLERNGKVVVFEKLVDDGQKLSWGRWAVGLFTRWLFADINRNLTQMMGDDTKFKIVYYDSVEGKLTGILGRCLAPYYRIGTLVRAEDYPDLPTLKAVLSHPKQD
ncbi:MAG: methyltransferase domain-containing protein [Alphaproteobacteria bacterium]|jgi:ubiquinone/menaquinone biosynthesis C-methylase UbiE|nr:methyltransferase domain-containing protein [Alphaproteobacteria bacterium]